MIDDFARGHLHEQIDAAAREVYRAKIERAAQEAAGGSDHADLSEAQGAVGTAP